MNEIIEELITQLRIFPGVGEKTARRYANVLIEASKEKQQGLQEAIGKLSAIKKCEICNNYAVDNTCEICKQVREEDILIVVSQAKDIQMMEAIMPKSYYYHVLGGIIDPLAGNNANDLNIDSLNKRINDKIIKEIILVLPTTLEGELTASYINEFLCDKDIKISKLAQGVPIGGSIEYIDEMTLLKSFEGRQQY